MTLHRTRMPLRMFLPVLMLLAVVPLSAAEVRVPVYVETADGGPAAPPDAGQLKLYLDNEPAEFTLSKYDPETGDGGKLNVIILDSCLTPYSDFVKAKRMAEQIVKTSPEGDSFAVIQITPLEGPQLILARETDKKRALKSILSLQMLSTVGTKKTVKKKQTTRSRLHYDRWKLGRYRALTKRHLEFLKRVKTLFKKEYHYETQVLRYSHFLSKFTKALNMVTEPKTAYLFSGGVGGELWSGGRTLDLAGERYEYTVFFKTFLRNLVREIHRDGCLLFTIVPGQSKNPLPAAAGFYELVVETAGDVEPGGPAALRLDDLQQNHRLTAPRFFAPPQPYESMPNHQKQLFLLDMVLEDPWVQLAARVEIAPFKLTAPAGEENPGETLTIALPDTMYRGDVDGYTLYVNPKTLAVDIVLSPISAEDETTLPIRKADGRDRFFILVEPLEMVCIFNRVKD